MANTLDKLVQRIMGRGLQVMRKKVLMTRLVNTDFKNEAKEYGETIDIPFSTEKELHDVVPSNITPDPTPQTTRFAQITINNWKGTDFGLNDMEAKKINASKFWIPDQIARTMDTLANGVNNSLYSYYKGVYGVVGSPGVTPFGSGVGVASATDMRKLLNKQGCPKERRNAILDYDAEANALGLDQFSSAASTGDNGAVKIKGEIGEKYGILWNADSETPYHTAGVGANTGVYTVDNSGGYPAEASLRYSTIHIDTASSNANSLVEGDIITFAGHTQTYSVISGISLAGAGEGDIVVSPGLQSAVADDAAITRTASHAVNLVFHPEAFGLAMRSPSMGMEDEQLVTGRVLADSVSGIIFRMEKIRLYKKYRWDCDMVWGAGLVKPERAGRLMG